MTPSADALHILDGTALLFRSYFAPNMRFTTPTGVAAGGVLGMTQVIARYLDRARPRRIAVVFDAAQPTFRHKLDATYKANRGAPPDDLLPQFALSRRAVAALGIRCLMVPGYEADDLMATLVERMPTVDRVVVSQDKDLIQLLQPGVWIRDDKSMALTDAHAAKEKHGVSPSVWTTYQALCGDSVDNIPGVRGVGAKTAAALICGLGDLDSIYRSLGQVAGLPIRGARTLAKKLEAGREDAYRSLTLVTLHRDVPDPSMQLQPDDLIWRGPASGPHEVYDELGFHRPLNRAIATANAMG